MIVGRRESWAGRVDGSSRVRGEDAKDVGDRSWGPTNTAWRDGMSRGPDWSSFRKSVVIPAPWIISRRLCPGDPSLE